MNLYFVQADNDDGINLDLIVVANDVYGALSLWARHYDGIDADGGATARPVLSFAPGAAVGPDGPIDAPTVLPWSL